MAPSDTSRSGTMSRSTSWRDWRHGGHGGRLLPHLRGRATKPRAGEDRGGRDGRDLLAATRRRRAEGLPTPAIDHDAQALQALKHAERRYSDWTPHPLPSPWHRGGLSVTSARHRALLIEQAEREADTSELSAQERRYLADMARHGPLLWRTLEESRVLNEDIERAPARHQRRPERRHPAGSRQDDSSAMFGTRASRDPLGYLSKT